MTRLLVSVRDTIEASVALAAGAHLIDLKEPRLGSLGPAAPDTIRAVCRLVAGRVPVSAALGELLRQPRGEMLDRASCVQYAKVGMAGCAKVADWQTIWARLLARFPATTTPVAVAYADWRHAHAPRPWEVLRRAGQLGAGGMLVDTFDKSKGGLVELIEFNELADLVRACREQSLFVVLAGSLSEQTIPQLLSLPVDYIAVRGAACTGGRQGHVDGKRIGKLLRLLGFGKTFMPSGESHALRDKPPTRV
jgi:uncharacterized protein (UPF0264 family)